LMEWLCFLIQLRDGFDFCVKGHQILSLFMI
jgi:hypothetical protein